MRTLIISDIHANANALNTALRSAGQVDAVWCLGDVVGYGPDPNECIARLKELPNLVCLQGNHDSAAIGGLSMDGFNIEARSSIEWLREHLSEDSFAFLQTLSPRLEQQSVTLAHASPRQPMLEYLLDIYAAQENFSFFDTELCFVGHTHVPVVFSLKGKSVNLQIPVAGEQVALRGRCIANPGSVGQPRDRDPRAAFAIFDDETGSWVCHRVEYDVPSVQERMRVAHLPERHIARLAGGW